MKKLVAIAALVVSSSAMADSDWISIPSESTSHAFLDRASFIEGANKTGITLLRSYEEKVTLGDDAQTGAEIFPHRSAKIRYAVECSTKMIAMESWVLYSGNLGDGNVVWADQMTGILPMSKPSSTEEWIAFNAVCSQDAALRQVVRHYASVDR